MTQPIQPALPIALGTASQTTDASRTSRSELPDAISVGARLEIQLARELSSGIADIRVRTAETHGDWSKPIRARILAPNPSGHGAPDAAARTGPNRLVADVVSVTPSLVLKLQPNPASGRATMLEPAAGTAQWRDAQLRRHLPQSKPLASTLETWLTQQPQSQPRTLAPGQQVAAGPPTASMRLLQPILEVLARPADLIDPDRLSKALTGTGIWLEATLARTALEPGYGENLGRDLKARLLLVADHLRRSNLAPTTSDTRETPNRPVPGKTQQAPELAGARNPLPQPGPARNAAANTGRDVPPQNGAQPSLPATRQTFSNQMGGLPDQPDRRDTEPDRQMPLRPGSIDTKGIMPAENRSDSPHRGRETATTPHLPSTEAGATAKAQRPFEEKPLAILVRRLSGTTVQENGAPTSMPRAQKTPANQMECLPDPRVQRNTDPERQMPPVTGSIDTKRALEVLTETRSGQTPPRGHENAPARSLPETEKEAPAQARRPVEDKPLAPLLREPSGRIGQAIGQQTQVRDPSGAAHSQPGQPTASTEPEIGRKPTPEPQIALESKGTQDRSPSREGDPIRTATPGRSDMLGANPAESSHKGMPANRMETTLDRPPADAGTEHARTRQAFDENLTRSLSRDVDGMVKQVITQQLQSLDRDPQEPRWVLELPLRTEDRVMAIEADIRRKKGKAGDREPGWDMKLRLDLRKLGPVGIHLHLRSGRLNASLSSESLQGSKILQKHLEQLRRQLDARDLDVGSLNASYRPERNADPLRESESPLLDDHA
ncbi:flagellar hook-length control protein FliK [Imhoffiella purpurea]|uniref:Flagellar hook-length control protein-like C-terminal domain-containing protein n=1 Tax=Imhoffiella purpurea TaxID=1249627 RepID=W9VIS0_9GAMM|nr:flagellar hook-length control protein FliK [Imhoffiella purpurea]EXJ16896.1 hypothetical protein D779_2507 [Imhoffiella purpurea]